MNMIYKNARHVLVWPGPDDKGVAKSAFELIHKLDETFKDEVKREKSHTIHTKDLEKQSREVWAPLDHLTVLLWVSRTGNSLYRDTQYLC